MNVLIQNTEQNVNPAFVPDMFSENKSLSLTPVGVGLCQETAEGKVRWIRRGPMTRVSCGVCDSVLCNNLVALWQDYISWPVEGPFHLFKSIQLPHESWVVEGRATGETLSNRLTTTVWILTWAPGKWSHCNHIQWVHISFLLTSSGLSDKKSWDFQTWSWAWI